MLDTKVIVSDALIKRGLRNSHDNYTTVTEARLMLLEILVKINAGYNVSYTERCFVSTFGLLTQANHLNKKGRLFVCEMVYKHSNLQAEMVRLSLRYRKSK